MVWEIYFNKTYLKNLACEGAHFLLLNNEALANFPTKIWNSLSAYLYPAVFSLFLCGMLTYTNVFRVSFFKFSFFLANLALVALPFFFFF